jgi:hypothetical protein
MRYTSAPVTLLPVNFRLESELIEAMRSVQQREGIPMTAQVRLALLAWLKSRGIGVKSSRKRAGARKRSS